MFNSLNPGLKLCKSMLDEKYACFARQISFQTYQFKFDRAEHCVFIHRRNYLDCVALDMIE